MLTGKFNYGGAAERLAIDLVNRPELAETPEVAVQTAGDYWGARDLNQHANEDHRANVVAMTQAINGGMNGFDDRLAYFMASGRVDWEQDEPMPPPVDGISPPQTVTLRWGDGAVLVYDLRPSDDI